MSQVRLVFFRPELFADVLGPLDGILDVDETSRDDNFAPLQPTHPDPLFELCGTSCSTPELECTA